AAALTFEELALMPVSGPARKRAKSRRPVSVQVSFDGPCAGTLYLSVDEQLLPNLAAKMLGEEEAPSMDLQCDALGEFANVVCGNLLPRIAGKEAVFDMGVPLLIHDISTYLLFDTAAEVRLDVEQRVAELRLLLMSHMETVGANL